VIEGTRTSLRFPAKIDHLEAERRMCVIKISIRSDEWEAE
jgi:hypothetical protein